MSVHSLQEFSDGPLFAQPASIELASECKHAINQGSPTAIYRNLAGEPDTASEEDCASISPTVILCDHCETAMRAELSAAEQNYMWHFACGTKRTDSEAYEGALKRARTAELRVAAYDAKMSCLAHHAQAREAKLAKWQAGKKVTFDVAEGTGPGEKPREKTVYIFGAS